MPLEADALQHVARLARLELSEAQTEAFQKDLGELLDYVALLKEALPSSSPLQQGVSLSRREDTAHVPVGQSLTTLSEGSSEGGWVLVPRVLPK